MKKKFNLPQCIQSCFPFPWQPFQTNAFWRVFFFTVKKSDGSFVPVVPSKTIPVQCFQTRKAWLHSTVLFPPSTPCESLAQRDAKIRKNRTKTVLTEKELSKKEIKIQGSPKAKERAHGTGEKRCY